MRRAAIMVLTVCGVQAAAAQAQQDMAFLCDSFAIPRLTATGPMPAQIVISLSDRPVPFGEPSEDATQFFEAYRPGDGICIWEPY
jgi:hypothetical protein